jgi:hypothetical protein
MKNFRSEDMKVAYAEDSSKSAKKSTQEKAPAPAPEPESQPQSAPEPQTAVPEQSEPEQSEPEQSEPGQSESEDEPVPAGTTAEILAWVGDDKERAQRALDKEQADDKPRAGLTGELKEVLEK